MRQRHIVRNCGTRCFFWSKIDLLLHLVIAVVLGGGSVCGLSRSLQRTTSRIPDQLSCSVIICLHWSSLQLQSSATFPHAADSQHAIMQALKTERAECDQSDQPGAAQDAVCRVLLSPLVSPPVALTHPGAKDVKHNETCGRIDVIP
jgi:hypothetical protein